MDAKQLIERIESYNGELPRTRFVSDVYAETVAKISAKLSQDEIEDLVALGALVMKRSTQLVPVLQWDGITEELIGGRPIV